MGLTEVGKLARKFECLATQLAVANTHLHFYKKLSEAWKGEFHREFHKARDFWDYAMRGHVQAALSGLCRVYDDRRKHDDVDQDAFHLLRFLEEAEKAKLEIEKTKLTEEERKLLRKDLDFLQRENLKKNIAPDPKVRKLRKWRHNFVAHQNIALVLGGREAFLREFPVNLDEIQALVDEGFSILERWTSCYKPQYKGISTAAGCRIKRMVSGKDDYLFVLESMRLGISPDVTAR